jgi:hypothetical protein
MYAGKVGIIEGKVDRNWYLVRLPLGVIKAHVAIIKRIPPANRGDLDRKIRWDDCIWRPHATQKDTPKVGTRETQMDRWSSLEAAIAKWEKYRGLNWNRPPKN